MLKKEVAPSYYTMAEMCLLSSYLQTIKQNHFKKALTIVWAYTGHEVKKIQLLVRLFSLYCKQIVINFNTA
jgi:hypothetical protein